MMMLMMKKIPIDFGVVFFILQFQSSSFKMLERFEKLIYSIWKWFGMVWGAHRCFMGRSSTLFKLKNLSMAPSVGQCWQIRAQWDVLIGTGKWSFLELAPSLRIAEMARGEGI